MQGATHLTVVSLGSDVYLTVLPVPGMSVRYHTNGNCVLGLRTVFDVYNIPPGAVKWKWGEDELPIADEYTYLGVELSLIHI